MARTGGRFNTLKIVPLITFQTLLERCKKVEDGSFFPEIVEQELVDPLHFYTIYSILVFMNNAEKGRTFPLVKTAIDR